MTARRTVRMLTLTTAAALAAALLAAPGAAEAATAPAGPDVSGWQHPRGAAISWSKVAAAGNSFAIIKATEGSSYTNPYYAGDAAGARRARLVVGAYHFARPALPISTATTQAKRFARVLGNVRTAGTMPPILDLEVTGGLSPAQLITWTQTFTETLRSVTGRTPVVYSYPSFWTTRMAGTRALTRYPLWLAAYRSSPPAPVGGWSAWTMWQYTAAARVSGISGAVDRSHFKGSAATLRRFADGRAATSWAVRAPSAPLSVRASARVRSASVSWVPSDDGGRLPSSYTVTASPGGATVSVAGTSTSATVPRLRTGASYTFSVRARNTAGTSTRSAASRAVVARGDVPTTPTRLTAKASSGRVTLAWAASARSPRDYHVYRCSSAPCTPRGSAVAVVAASRRSYVDTAVAGGRHYAYAVAATNKWGFSARSRSAQATPPVTSHRAKPSVSAVLSATTVRLGRSVVLSGGTSPAYAGERIYRQGYYSGAWHTWASTLVSRTGTYRFAVKPTVRATNTYRLLLPATTRHLTGASASLRLRAR